MVRGRPKAFDSELALEKAMEVFRENGYESTNVPDLLQHMGIGRQSLYDTFGDKVTLFKASLKRYLDQGYLKVMSLLDRPESPLGNIKAIIRELAPEMSSGKNSCLAANSSAEFGSTDAEIAALLKNHFDRLSVAFENALVSARQAGEISSSADPASLGHWLVNSLNGMAVMGRLGVEQRFIDDVVDRTIGMLENS